MEPLNTKDIITMAISLSALLVSYLNRRRTIKLDHQAIVLGLEVKRQEYLSLATKINLAQIERNVTWKRLSEIVEKLPATIIAKFKETGSFMQDLSIKKEALAPVESMVFSGTHDEQIQIERNIGVLINMKEISDKYDLLVSDVVKDLGLR